MPDTLTAILLRIRCTCSDVWHSTARVLLRSHIHRNSRRPWVTAMCGCALLAAASNVSAQAAPALGTERPRFTAELRLGAGASSSTLMQLERAVADQTAIALGGGGRLGWFAGSYLQIGAELYVAQHIRTGTIDVREESGLSEQDFATRTDHTLVAPLGLFMEIYPWPKQGLFLGLSGSVGGAGPTHGTAQNTALMAGFALELGYELSAWDKQGLGFFVRHARWAASDGNEYPEGFWSQELLLGARWTFVHPDWR